MTLRIWRIVRCLNCHHARLTFARRGTGCSMCKRPGHRVRMRSEEWLF